MNRKLYVLGAVLGAVPGLLPGVCATPVAPSRETTQEAGRARVARAQGSVGNHAVATPVLEPRVQEASPDAGAQVPTLGTQGADVPRHPCELMTVVKVPCDETGETCEYTYWECPAAVNPLRA